ncbi:MAG TPA: dihydroxyacetone kinase subunit DhaK [Geminicoccus sp.]|jgi:dihydroxyacetone kinase-like protein|uniref:dihydroxyacetone kinase subunit DhaK n=1 Tax=Geminicoccus sp. TaxID=2024832 RepID=UPI002E3530C8|nr:dihydroxyacetone kinase subunit DhaK [Geminicoccus sp.]HEX2525668.1 dihydroxyacetone kinase subunit DhaK [Geminicoccus sp.]
MKKFINDVDDILVESLTGFGRAHADLVEISFDPTFVRRKTPTPAGKVVLISGGGSGHEPLHAGFVGHGMLDAACPGHVFTSPTPDQMIAAAAAVDGGAGTLWIVKNYSGDVMNFEMAAEMAEGEHATVLIVDDVAVENSSFTVGRRGVAGTMIAEKMLGAGAEAGLDLAALKALGDKVAGQTRSMGVAFSSCIVPAAGSPTFTLGDNEMEMGVGIHGEPGRRRVPLASAHDIADEMTGAILQDLAPKAGQQILLHVNGFGGTPLMELYLMYDEAAQILEKRGLKVARSLVGNYTTSLEMAGCSITVTTLDEQLTELWDAPVHTPALRWGR